MAVSVYEMKKSRTKLRRECVRICVEVVRRRHHIPESHTHKPEVGSFLFFYRSRFILLFELHYFVIIYLLCAVLCCKMMW